MYVININVLHICIINIKTAHPAPILKTLCLHSINNDAIARMKQTIDGVMGNARHWTLYSAV